MIIFYLFRLFIDLLKLGPNSSDALKLKNYRSPTSASHNVASTSTQNVAGDFAAVLYSVVKDRAYDGEKVSAEELNQRFVLFLTYPVAGLDPMEKAKA
jgi:hypothetical protein